MPGKGKKGGKKGKKKKKKSGDKTSAKVAPYFPVKKLPGNYLFGDHISRKLVSRKKKQEAATKLLAKAFEELNDAPVDLSGYMLVEVPPMLGELRHIQELNMSNNQLFSVERCFAVVVNLQHLRTLRICNNFLNGDIPETVGNLSKLELFDMSRNTVTDIPESVKTMVNLRELRFPSNGLACLPGPALLEWVHLRAIDVSTNKIMFIPREIKSLINLRSFKAGNNRIMTIPSEIGQCSNLTELILTHNQITELPQELGDCVKLDLLSLAGNKLEAISPELFEQLPELQKLYLYKNKLTSLPDSVGDLHKLEVLSVANNKLGHIPATIGNLKALQEFYAGGNAAIKILPPELGALENISTVSFCGCVKIKAIPASVIDGWSATRTLREFDVRSLKKKGKDPCKIPEWMIRDLSFARVRGGQIKRGKKGRRK